jgi:cytochrome c oxidase cbb3-type subunit 3
MRMFAWLVAALCAASGAAGWALYAQKQAAGPGDGNASNAVASRLAGRRIFVSSCAACHGLDGHGGERAPDILTRAELQRMSQAEIERVIRNGVPTKRMPAFAGALEPAQIRDAAAYLHGLMHGSESAEVRGDPVAGKELFYGKAACSGCHMVNGEGGFLASDLSLYGGLHSASEMHDAIVDPTKVSNRGERQVTATLRDGDEISGVARNEDNFSLQVQSSDSKFHLLMKSDLAKLEFSPEPLMPSDYAQKLTARELDDVISFLVRAAESNAKAAPGAARSKNPDDED